MDRCFDKVRISFTAVLLFTNLNVSRKWRRNLPKETGITEMCRSIVSRYNYARVSAVRASRIVRTRYFNENWLELAATTLIVAARSSWLSDHGARAFARAMQKYRGEPRRDATRRPPSAAARRCGRAFIFILENRKRPPRARHRVPPAVAETTNTSNGFQGLRLSPRPAAARSKDPIVRFVRADSISARDSCRKNYARL